MKSSLINIFTGTAEEIGTSIGKSIGRKEFENNINRMIEASYLAGANNYSATVYSNIACPAENLIYFAYDGYPAANRSKWQKVEWKW